LNLPIGANNSEGNLSGDFLVLSDCLLIIIVVDGSLEDLNLVVGNIVKNALLEFDDLLVGESISLGDNGDEVDAGMQSAHEFHIDLFQSVASGLQEVDASMDTVIRDFLAVELVFLGEVRVETRLDVLENWSPAISSGGQCEITAK
jgi:hypothetical protein